MEDQCETERLARGLAEVEGVRCVTRGWPEAFAADTLPCVALQLAGEQGSDFRDGQEYITQREYYVRVFARQTAALDTLAAKVKQRMEALGYARVFLWEDFSAEVKQTVMRYRGHQ